MQKTYRFGFTLVELVVTITIISILSAIGFVSYSSYLLSARDSSRFSQLAGLSDSLQVYAANRTLPIPSDYANVLSTASGQLLWYQWYMWEDILDTLDYSNGWRDPKNGEYFVYYLSGDRKSVQLMAFMEESTSSIATLPSSYATDYLDRYPKTYGNKLWIILLEESVTPIQDLTLVNNNFEIDTTTESHSVYFWNGDTITWEWYVLSTSILSRLGTSAPLNCPDGFIGVPGHAEFHQEGFCIAQYEMTYSDADTPNTLDSGNRNTVVYIEWQIPVSQAWTYPIASINQLQAITACQNMWDGIHLVTNDEWMTVARNIERTPENWSTGVVGLWYLYNGVSNNETLWCNSTWGNTEPRPYWTTTWPWTDTNCNIKREFTLSNGLSLWDIAWNVSEHVNKANTDSGVGYNEWQTTVSWASELWPDADGLYGIEDMKKYSGAYWFERSQWWGSVFVHSWNPENVFVRWGHSTRGSETSPFYIRLDMATNWNEDNVGFRCAK